MLQALLLPFHEAIAPAAPARDDAIVARPGSEAASLVDPLALPPEWTAPLSLNFLSLLPFGR